MVGDHFATRSRPSVGFASKFIMTSCCHREVRGHTLEGYINSQRFLHCGELLTFISSRFRYRTLDMSFKRLLHCIRNDQVLKSRVVIGDLTIREPGFEFQDSALAYPEYSLPAGC
jgi:hypothetical protein